MFQAGAASPCASVGAGSPFNEHHSMSTKLGACRSLLLLPPPPALQGLPELRPSMGEVVEELEALQPLQAQDGQ